MATYEIVNPPAFSKKAQHGKFIYVLMFNVPGIDPKPFYVGQTSGLTARFNNHAMVMWHFAKFNAPVRVWIAGEVPGIAADSAEQDLITRLSGAGYLLTNRSIDMSWAKRAQRTGNLMEMTGPQVLTYLRSRATRTNVLTDWHARWAKPAPAYTTAGATLTTAQVISYVSGLDYALPAIRNISLAIAEHHDPALGHSRVILTDALRGVPGAGNVPKYTKRLTSIWYFRRGILPTSPHDFRLTRRHLAAIAKTQPGPQAPSSVSAVGS